MKLVFLDIDGVLNGHDRHPNGFCGIDPRLVGRLNRILVETDASVVVSSAWRYMIGPDLSLRGFGLMLLTYGLAMPAAGRESRVVGATTRDEIVPGRGEQIEQYLRLFPRDRRPAYVVLDDGGDGPPNTAVGEDCSLSESLARRHAPRWVRTAPDTGLTDADAEIAIKILRER